MSAQPNAREFSRGLSLFNLAHFFAAHEVLEDVWRATALDSASRRHLQGFVQLAVAFHHQSTGNLVGARSVLERGMRNLSGADSSFPDLDLDRLRCELDTWRQYLDDHASASDVAGHGAPDLPKILLRR